MSLTEEQKLVMLGLRSPNSQESGQGEVVKIFQDNIAEDYDDFVDAFEDGLDDGDEWDDFEDWLVDEGVGEDTAEGIREELEEKFDDFGDYYDVVVTSNSWEDYETNFRIGNAMRSDLEDEDGRSAAGVKFYEESGIGRDGQRIPQGGVEVYGTQVHFSQTDEVRIPAEDQSDEPITYTNLEVSNTLPTPHEIIVVSATVTNSTGIQGLTVEVPFEIDGEVVESEDAVIDANESEDVEFTHQFSEYGGYDVTIGDLPDERVVVTHPSLMM